MPDSPPIPRTGGTDSAQARFAAWLGGVRARAGSLRTWAAPGQAVALRHPDGSESVWQGGMRLPDGAAGKAPKFVAVELPEEMVLRRDLLLPRMTQEDSAEAVRLEARSNSPFAAEDLAWGSVERELEGGQKSVSLALASRRHIEQFMQQRWPEMLAAARQPEVWAMSAQGVPVVILGYGEVHRLHDASLERRWNWALAAVAVALATLVAITPTIQLRLRALEAVQAFDTVLRRVAPLVRKRDELAALNDKARALDQLAAERVDPAAVMEYLTRVLPDDTYLYSLDIQKNKITASGHTVDASAVLQKLSSDPMLKNVKAPTAVTRLPGAAKEAFVIEFTMEPKPVAANGAALVANALPPAAGASTAASAPVAVPAAPAASAAVAAPAVAAAPVAAPKAPLPAKPASGSSPFVIGGSR
ncbi:PilN domain-containing protein [Caenimonas terrae]|uniref:PilN domain-containing protein n=1 Tax=Caenimonas terrae TaxID=696074 RepID=A0ABW0NLA7_9BURK